MKTKIEKLGGHSYLKKEIDGACPEIKSRNRLASSAMDLKPQDRKQPRRRPKKELEEHFQKIL